MSTKRAIHLLLGLGALALALPGHATELTRGAILAGTCAACHGTDGRSHGEMPSIAGLSAAQIQTAMKEFRAGDRPSTVMQRLTRGYSDEDIRLVAEYWAGRKTGGR